MYFLFIKIYHFWTILIHLGLGTRTCSFRRSQVVYFTIAFFQIHFFQLPWHNIPDPIL